MGFGIVGCGGMGRWHAKSLADLPRAKLIGVTDIEPTAREAVARRFRVRAYPSLGELLGDPDVEVVSVCTPPQRHVDVVLAAAEAGRHLLVEKPLALGLKEADRAIAACEEAGVQLGVVHQQRARSASRTVHRLLADGRLGEPRLAAVVHSWYRSSAELESDPWRKDPTAGGGVLHDQAVHAIDLLVWLLGPPRWTGASVGPRQGGHGEDTVVAALGFDGGGMATLAASTATNAMRDDIALELYGSRGSVRLEIRNYDHAEIAWVDLAAGNGRRARRLAPREVERLVQAEGGRWRRGPRDWPWRGVHRVARWERGAFPFRSVREFLRRRVDRIAQRETGELQGHAALLDAMAEAARGDGRPLVTGEEARMALAVIEALGRSHRAGGRRVEISAP